MSNGRLMVVGALPYSLGSAVVRAWPDPEDVVEVGLPTDTYEPDFDVDLNDADCDDRLLEIMAEKRIRHVVCTAGINRPGDFSNMMNMADHLALNCIGVLRVLNAWIDTSPARSQAHFVAISSNSAHIARTNSAAYCASKAALSMAIRCVAREFGGRDMAIYCYEPGLLDTPQTRALREELAARKGVVSMHRIPNNDSLHGLNPEDLALLIVRNILNLSTTVMNGACIRLDGGEQ